jgi:hypothetical protein
VAGVEAVQKGDIGKRLGSWSTVTGNIEPILYQAVQEALGMESLPTGAPLEIIGKLNRELDAGLTDPKIKARIADSEEYRCQTADEARRKAPAAIHLVRA